MAGYGNIPTDRNASTAVIDPASYLGDKGSFQRLSTTDVAIIVGVSVFFGLLILAIFAWQFRAIRHKRKLAAIAAVSDKDDDDEVIPTRESPPPGRPTPSKAASRPTTTEQVELRAIPRQNPLQHHPPSPVIPPRAPALRRDHQEVETVAGNYPTLRQHASIGSLIKTLREGQPMTVPRHDTIV